VRRPVAVELVRGSRVTFVYFAEMMMPADFVGEDEGKCIVFPSRILCTTEGVQKTEENMNRK
jgi:hypothetical protein